MRSTGDGDSRLRRPLPVRRGRAPSRPPAASSAPGATPRPWPPRPSPGPTTGGRRCGRHPAPDAWVLRVTINLALDKVRRMPVPEGAVIDLRDDAPARGLVVDSIRRRHRRAPGPRRSPAGAAGEATPRRCPPVPRRLPGGRDRRLPRDQPRHREDPPASAASQKLRVRARCRPGGSPCPRSLTDSTLDATSTACRPARRRADDVLAAVKAEGLRRRRRRHRRNGVLAGLALALVAVPAIALLPGDDGDDDATCRRGRRADPDDGDDGSTPTTTTGDDRPSDDGADRRARRRHRAARPRSTADAADVGHARDRAAGAGAAPPTGADAARRAATRPTRRAASSGGSRPRRQPAAVSVVTAERSTPAPSARRSTFVVRLVRPRRHARPTTTSRPTAPRSAQRAARSSSATGRGRRRRRRRQRRRSPTRTPSTTPGDLHASSSSLGTGDCNSPYGSEATVRRSPSTQSPCPVGSRVPCCDGIRVVELGVWVAGPGAGGVLADWGADVIKVEAPGGRPDAAHARRRRRRAGGPPEPAVRPRQPGQAVGRPRPGRPDGAGREAMAALLGDRRRVPHEPPARRRRRGSGSTPSRLLADAPPPRLRVGHRLRPRRARTPTGPATTSAPSGPARASASLAVPPDAPQPHFRGGVGDHVTAITTVAGILGALLERERTGRGRLVETSLLRTGIWCARLGPGPADALRQGAGGASPAPSRATRWSTSYRAGDGRWFWLLGVEGDRLWPKLLRGHRPRGVGRRRAVPHDARPPPPRRRADRPARRAVRHAGRGTSGPRRSTPTTCGGRRSTRAEDVLEDPQAIAAGAFVDVPGGAGTPEHRAVATPGVVPERRRRATPPAREAAVPGLGEHTAEVLAELGSEPLEPSRSRQRAPSRPVRAQFGTGGSEARGARLESRRDALGVVGALHQLLEQPLADLDGGADVAVEVGVQLGLGGGDGAGRHLGRERPGVGEGVRAAARRAGSTLLTSPIVAASSASTTRLESSRSAAWPMPTRRGQHPRQPVLGRQPEPRRRRRELGPGRGEPQVAVAGEHEPDAGGGPLTAATIGFGMP